MSDDDKKKSIDSSKDKVINVTKPREVRSNLDISRVSDLTLREQQSLDRLRKKVGNSTHVKDRASHIKSIIAIALVCVLIALAVVFIILISQNTTVEEDEYNIRMSMMIENESVLHVVTDTGKEELRKINPGDVLPIKAFVKNSDNYLGDNDVTDTSANPPNCYVRFKIKVVLGYEEDRQDIIRAKVNTNWYVWNAEDEASIPDGRKESDNYYYYKGSLPYTKRAEMFSEIQFYGPAITIEDGGKYGQIQIIVQSIPAEPNALADGIWPTAPKKWVLDIINGVYRQ